LPGVKIGVHTPDVDRALAIVARHGRETMSFQTLEPGLAHWFRPGDQACVAFADTGAAWVGVGGPVCSVADRPATAHEFAAAARDAGRRVRFFGVEPDAGPLPGWDMAHIGEQPHWEPARWPDRLRKKKSLREQLRRARAKGVAVRAIQSADLADPDSPDRRKLDRVVIEWLSRKPMAPMQFAVSVELYTAPGERRVWVAEVEERTVGVLAAVPVYARGGWFFEDVLRAPQAPNGTVELMFDHAMRAVADDGARDVTYGLAPLSNTPHAWLRRIRDNTSWLYDFEGLVRFKSKLLPDRWSPVHLAYPEGEPMWRAFYDSLAAFAGGSFVRYGLSSAGRAPRRWLSATRALSRPRR